MEVINWLKDTRQWMIDGGDPRADNWFMMQDPVYPLTAIVLYYLMVIFLPKFMEHREPFKLRWALIIYNAGLVLLCGWMVYEMTLVAYLSGYSLVCEPVDYSRNELPMRMLAGTWWFFFSKIIELADTLFFILRKKNDQVSFLHVYHHSTMPFLIWCGCKYIGGGQVWLVGVANSLVHVVMYTYYAISAIGPHMHKYLWWKKHLTKMQLCHFFTIMGHVTVNMLVAKDCGYPSLPNWTIIIYTNSQVVLFANFYYNAYIKKRRDIKSKKTEKSTVNNNVANGATNKALHNGVGNGVNYVPVHDNDLRKRGAKSNGHISNARKH